MLMNVPDDKSDCFQPFSRRHFRRNEMCFSLNLDAAKTGGVLLCKINFRLQQFFSQQNKDDIHVKILLINILFKNSMEITY